MQTEKGITLKCLRTDNGLEFLSDDFRNLCKERGITRHKTVPANPQQNGVIEGMNKIILDRVRCMLLGSGLPKKFWGEAVNTACFLINNCPSAAIEFQSPDEKWFGYATGYIYLRAFGCRAYAHINRTNWMLEHLNAFLLVIHKELRGISFGVLRMETRR